MKKKWFAAANAALASVLVALGFSSCKTSNAARKSDSKEQQKQERQRVIPEEERRVRVLYGVPNTRFRKMPVKPIEPEKPLPKEE